MESYKEEFLKKTREEREQRLAQKKRDAAARVVQKFVRSATGKLRAYQLIREEIDNVLSQTRLITGLELFFCGRKLLFVNSFGLDSERFNNFCQVLLDSMEKPNIKAWYVTVALNKTFAVMWIHQMKKILLMCCENLKGLKPGLPRDNKLLTLYMNMIVLFTDYTLWKFTSKAGDAMKPTLQMLCSKFIEHLVANGFFPIMHGVLGGSLAFPYLKIPGHTFAAATGIRQLALCHFPCAMLVLFARFILSVPACVLHLQQHATETINQLQKVNFACRLIEALQLNLESLSNITPNSALCVLGNILQLSSMQMKVIIEQNHVDGLLAVLTELIAHCDSKNLSGKGAVSSWHPFFGWTSDKVDRKMLDSLGHVRVQLQCLWKSQFVECLFSPILALTPAKDLLSTKRKARFSLFKKTSVSVNIDSATLEKASRICLMYDQCIKSLNQLATDVLIGLGCNSGLVSKMWHFIWLYVGLDEDKIMRLICSNKIVHPICSVLRLCCEASQYLLATLDDEELFVQELHFSKAELQEISVFLNKLVFKMIMESQTDSSTIFSQCHALLVLLYNKNSRRTFCDQEHWYIKNFKVSMFMSELKAGKPRAQKLLHFVPHVIPHRQRVEHFHHKVNEDKERLGISRSNSHRRPATYITIHRGHVLDNGYIQLAELPANSFKGTIRVKFVNEQGLEEPGIDETGVFKEFLEEVIKKAFDPSLNLFKVNSQGDLYPSTTSHIHEDHLSLFEFVGTMLGKAVYEGVVVDVPFAPFFLSQMLEHHYSAFYSCLDELPSMDPELYKSLCSIKHYEGDVNDLCLTFSWDEDFMGKIVTQELIPGGASISVDNENRINYVHRMAHFRMNTQLQKQSAAFIKGFHSIVNKRWIACFSPQELQRLISGDHAELDVDDLRKHCQYYGGYHDKHKIVVWLWEILKNDFNAEEKSEFLKFVTSCSKPPLLGFEHLEPPFSIRCVQVAEEEDQGDSLGSIIKGFFSVRNRGARDRLPTASTCFNLLKLPNYTRKSVLRDKLKYAIESNAGFELS